MATQHSSAGVYTTEINLSAYINTSSTTTGVVVGASHKGPALATTLITNTQEFISVFGNPDPSISMMHYSALAFLEEGSKLYVTRVVQTDALSAGAYLTTDDPTAATPILRLSNFDDGSSNPLGIYDPI